MEEEMRKVLLRDGLIAGEEAEIVPLTGGVSSEIYRVRDGARVFAVKRALRKLKVADDWYADLSRNASEAEFLRCVGRIVPGAVPEVIFASAKDGYFAMEFLGDGFHNWKALLLEGVCEPEHARRAARVLARIHGATWDDPRIRARFETTENFRQLRLDPYLLTTGKRHPDLEPLFIVEAGRIEATRRCLVHGDYSPKNLLLSADRLVVLDCEVAWFGDPVFDVGFLLNHFLLKSLHNREKREAYFLLARIFEQEYRAELGEDKSAQILPALPRLLLMLMLARVDGKSPVEYLGGNEGKKNLVRNFARRHIPRPPGDLGALLGEWEKALKDYHEN
jgi:aminoglycoside phosphotransferase (APT) family kinase protein